MDGGSRIRSETPRAHRYRVGYDWSLEGKRGHYRKGEKVETAQELCGSVRGGGTKRVCGEMMR